MSVPWPEFCGPSYQLDNRYAAIERTVNWYLVPNETLEEKKFRIALAPCPGNAAFSPLPVPAPFNQPNRGLLELRGTAYGVNGNVVFSIDQNGVYTNLGPIADDHKPVSMVANGNGQIFIASAGHGYVIPALGGDGSLIIIGGGLLGASHVTFQDGYILAIVPNSNQFQIGGSDATPLGDATIWSAANVSVAAGQADKLRAIISSREYVRILGDRRTQIYTNVGVSGVGGFPFQNYNETFIETGIAAVFSLTELGESLIWVGQSERGQRACWRDHAFQPVRVSNFAVEQKWQNYARVDDAVAFAFIWNGHVMWQVTFPTVSIAPVGGIKTSATWIYDVTASDLIERPVWTERSYQTSLGYAQGRSEMFHCYCYGKHLVGSTGVDGNPGAIYQYSVSPTDCGVDINGAQTQQAIVRDRICPHLFQGNKRVIYNRIEFELSRGVGLDGGVFGANPKILLRWSNDGGNTFGREYPLAAGQIGEYSKRVYFNRAGYSRDRVFWLRSTDPVYWGVVGAELDMFVAS